MTHEQPRGGEDVGSVGEEAAKLLGALQDWAQHSGAHQAAATGAAATGVADGLRQLNRHVAAGGEDCRYCPLCRLISVLRGVSPEVRAHLASAAGSLLQATASAMATQAPDAARRSSPEGTVEHIDLDDEPEHEDD